MDRAQLQHFFPDEAIDQAFHANALRVAESYEFMRPDTKGQRYTERALDAVVQLRLPFSSTHNSFTDIFRRYVKVTCPYCGGKTSVSGAGGSGNHMGVEFKCGGCASTFNFGAEAESGVYVRPGDWREREEKLGQ